MATVKMQLPHADYSTALRTYLPSGERYWLRSMSSDEDTHMRYTVTHQRQLQSRY